MIYFHGNSEDVGHNIFFLMRLREMFNMTIIAMEYPGYGFFSHQIIDGRSTDKKLSCSAKKIQTNGAILIRHLLKPKEQGGLGLQNKDIYILGRSIGTGPACLFARIFKIRAVILISAYTSIKNVAANLAGKFLSFFVAQHFNNLAQVRLIECPMFLIHGKKDTLIPSSHSETLYQELQNQIKKSNYPQLPRPYVA
jgi:abhydrolase domain-containing protein 17